MKYKVKFVDMPKHYQSLRKEILNTVDRVLSRGDVILRDDMRKFEKDIAKFVGTKFAVGVNSGFDALHLSVRAGGIGPGDEVITVAHTFVATVAAVVHCGGTPILIDVGQDFNLNADQLEKAITRRTKAIIPVHLNGRLCNMEKIMSIARRHKLLVIEDAAQALGAKFKGKRAGSFGLTGCFSLYPFKMLGAFGDAGIVTTNSQEMAKKITWLRDHGQDRLTGDIRLYGFNCRLDNLHAAMLNVKFKHFPSWINRRREVAERYRQGLRDLTTLQLPHFGDTKYFDVYQNYVIRAEKRDELVAYLRKKGIEILISWSKPMHHHQALGLKKYKLPETERICREVLSLPMNAEISNQHVDYVIQSIRRFYRR
jgi:dTDP-4-amino-4,6-dideoxygalactose transaminase